MLDLLVVKVREPSQYLFGVVPDGGFIKVTVLRENIRKACFHLLQIDAKKLVEQLATVELHDVGGLKLLVLLYFVLFRRC